MLFANHRISTEPSNHYTNCYCGMLDPTKRRKGKNTLRLEYPHIPSSIAPVPHNTTDLPVPQPLTINQSCLAEASTDNSEKKKDASSSSSVMYRGRQFREERCPHYPNREDITVMIGFERWH